MFIYNIKHLGIKICSVFLALTLILGLVNVGSAYAASASMYFTPQMVARVGTPLYVEIRVDTGGELVNAVQSDLTYPSAQLTLDAIDTSDSSFGVAAPTSGGGGAVSVIRANIGAKSGNLLVARLKFTVQTVGTITLSFQNTSVLLRASDTQDVLVTKNPTSMNTLAGTYKPVYRLANFLTHERLFTTDAGERDYAVSHYAGWVYEGTSYYTFTTQATGTMPVYRLANYLTHERLFTADAGERDYAVSHYAGWVYEGISYYAFAGQTPGTVPVYRLANYLTHERLFTTDAGERDYAVSHYAGWVYEGTSYYTSTQ